MALCQRTRVAAAATYSALTARCHPAAAEATLYVRGFLAGGRPQASIKAGRPAGSENAVLEEKHGMDSGISSTAHGESLRSWARLEARLRGQSSEANSKKNPGLSSSSATSRLGRPVLPELDRILKDRGHSDHIHALSCPQWSVAHERAFVPPEPTAAGTPNGVDQLPRREPALEFSWRTLGSFEGDVSTFGLSAAQTSALGTAAGGLAVWGLGRRWLARRSLAAVGLPHLVGLLGAAELAHMSYKSIRAYNEARSSSGPAGQASVELARELRLLRSAFSHVRVVGHSLGAKLVVDACRLLADAERPDEAHLCALAATEDEVREPLLRGLTRASSHQQPSQFLYYTAKDTVLAAFPAFHGGNAAVGCVGLLEDGQGTATHQRDVSEFLTAGLAHWQYKTEFPKFAWRPH